MSLRLRDALMRELGTLRYEPTEKRIRGMLGEATVIDSTRARLVWEPKRVVPTYAFPVQDIDAEIVPAPPPPPRGGGRPGRRRRARHGRAARRDDGARPEHPVRRAHDAG